MLSNGRNRRSRTKSAVHAAAGIVDRCSRGLAAVVSDAHSIPIAVSLVGVLGVADDVLDDRRQPLGIGHAPARGAPALQLPAPARDSCSGRQPRCTSSRRSTATCAIGRRRAAQLLDQPRHALDGVGDRVDRVVDELRIVLVTLRVGDDELQLRHRVLQVVHHESGQAVVGLELAALGQPAIGIVLREVGRDVPARRSSAGRDPRR